MNLSLLKSVDLPKAEFKSGDVLLEKGDRSSKVFVLLSGEIAITVEDHLLAKERSPGSIVGEISALLGSPIVATVTATEDSEFYVIEDLIEFLKGNPEISIHVSQTLAYRLVYMNEHFVEIRDAIAGMQGKLSSYLPVFSRESMSNFRDEDSD